MKPIQIQLTNHQIAMARISALYLQPLKNGPAWLILLGVVLISLVIRALTYRDPFEAAEILLGALILGGSWFILIYTRERGSKAAARMYVEGFRLTQTPDGLEYRVGESAEILKWAEFDKSLTAGRWIFLYFNPRFALIVPRSAFASDEEFAEWERSAAEHIQRSKTGPSVC